MPSEVITDIPFLVNARSAPMLLRGSDLLVLPVIVNAFLIIEDGYIAGFGDMKNCPHFARSSVRATGAILPCWCDSHTHLVFAGSREQEFVRKIKGDSYAAIAAEGGGILRSVKQLNDTSEDDLFNIAWARLREVSLLGTGAVEIKSGYGLSLDGELKMLRVIKKLKERSSLIIKSTFLGAHAYPAAYKNDHPTYVNILINEMLPVIAGEGLADFVDVFCENGFFSPGEMATVCNAAAGYGLKPKLHVNQLSSIGGVPQGIKCGAVSLDHLEVLTPDEIALIASSETVATLLPSAAFFLNMVHSHTRALINAGAAVAIASDYNPGSSPSGNMNLVLSLACIQMKMLPEEAINAATVNGAWAMGVQDIAGSISPGKKANLIFTKPLFSVAYLPYAFGTNNIDRVMINGEFIS